MSTEHYSAVAEIAERHRENIVEGDELLKEICQAGRRPTFAEMTFFSRELGWDETAVNQQVRRMHNVLRLQAIAGTTADRQAAAKESETAAALVEKEGAKLAAKIAELQAKANGLERDAKLSARRVEEQTEATSKLRELVPEHVAGSVSTNVKAIKSTLGREISDAEIRLNELQCCLTPGNYNSESVWLEMLERSHREAVERFGNPSRRKLSASWPAIKASMETELRSLEDKLTELRPQLDAALAEARRPLSYYAN